MRNRLPPIAERTELGVELLMVNTKQLGLAVTL
jgi:hypothetical protein